MITDSGVTRGTAPGDTLQRGDTYPKEKFCGQIYTAYWRNEVGEVKKV